MPAWCGAMYTTLHLITEASSSMMQGDFGLSLTQDGYLPAAFLVRCLTLCTTLPLPWPGRNMKLPEFQGLS